MAWIVKWTEHFTTDAGVPDSIPSPLTYFLSHFLFCYFCTQLENLQVAVSWVLCIVRFLRGRNERNWERVWYSSVEVPDGPWTLAWITQWVKLEFQVWFLVQPPPIFLLYVYIFETTLYMQMKFRTVSLGPAHIHLKFPDVTWLSMNMVRYSGLNDRN